MLMSSMGFTFTTHYCGGFYHSKSLSIGVEDLNCGMEIKADIPCEQTDNVLNDNCCQNEFQEFKITEKFQPATHKIDVDLQFVIAFIDTYIQLISAEKEHYSKYLNYQPPLPDRDIPVLIQSFLI